MQIENNYFVHESVYIDNDVQIGQGTKIWHFTHILQNAIIGSNCILGQNVMIDRNVVIGNGVKIQNNVSVYTGVQIEDDVFIGPSVVFTNVINPRAFIERKQEFKISSVGKGASVGANATIICGVALGKYCFIGAGAVVTKNVADFALVVGNPAKQVGWVSKAGYQINFDENNKAYCPKNKDTYLLNNGDVVAVN